MRKWAANGIRATQRRRSRKSRKWTRRPTRQRSRGFRSPSRSMIPGALRGPPSPPSKRNKKPIRARRVMPTAGASRRWRVLVTGVKISATDQKSWPAVVELGERDADTLVAAPDPTAAADELIGLDLKREC